MEFALVAQAGVQWHDLGSLPRLECNDAVSAQLTTTSASQVQEILLPQPLK